MSCRLALLGCALVACGASDAEAPAAACAPQELALPDGGCIRPGVPPDGCGEGFAHDGADGCEPLLPADACAPGTMAVPGEGACRPVAPCAEGKWGDIPVDAATVYVDGAYAGGDGDGSAEKPWPDLLSAVAAAAPGALIAMAAGSYVGDVVIVGKPLRLWGVCPERVEIVAAGTAPGCADAGVCVGAGASGTELHALAIRGDTVGFVMSGSTDVVLDRLWVHDNADRGIGVQDNLGATSCTVRGCLVEDNRSNGVFVSGADVTIERSVVRDTLAGPMGDGKGIEIAHDPLTGVASRATVLASVIERNRQVGVFVSGSEVTVEASVVRDTTSDDRAILGQGILVTSSDEGVRSLATVRTSLLERNRDVGLDVRGSDATIEATIVRDTSPTEGGVNGHGISLIDEPLAGASHVLIERSVSARNQVAGVYVNASELTIDTTVVRDTLPGAQGEGGIGVAIFHDELTLAPSSASVSATLVERCGLAGVLVVDSMATVARSAILRTHASPDGQFGDALLAIGAVAAPGAVVIDALRIEDSARAGISSFGATVSLAGTTVQCAAFSLAAESNLSLPPQFEDRGGNLCGCPTAGGACVAVSTGLAPPPSL